MALTPISEVTKDMACEIEMEITITGMRWYNFRIWLAYWIIWLAACVIPMKATVTTRIVR
jgi:hypothetical protein